MKNALIVTNFSAGRKKAIKYKKRILNFVLNNFDNFKFIELNQLKTTDIAPFDTVIALGGDGTVSKIIPYLVNTEKVLGIIPCGTANLLSAKIGIPLNLDKALKIIKEGKVQSVDILNINNEYSSLRCGFGYDSDIICKTPQSLKNKFGYFAYFISGIIFALRLKKKEYNLNIDGHARKVSASCIIFANAANMYRNLVVLADKAMLNDGRMNIFLLKTTNPILFFIEFLKIIFNIRKNSRLAEYYEARMVDFYTSWTVCHIDGEKKNLKDNVNIRVIEKAINVFCSRKIPK